MTLQILTNPRKSASQQRSRVTVEAILDATARILTKEGYARASTNRIAAVAGVSIGSLYQYFPNKQALIAALVARHNREILDLLEQAMQHCVHDKLVDAMRDLVRAMLAAHRINPALHRIFKEEVPRIGKLVEVEAIRKDTLDVVKRFMQQCQDEILVSDLEAAAFICVTTVEALTHALVINDCGHSLTEEEDAVEHVTRLLAGYLSIAPEPLRPILKLAGSLPG